MKPVKKRKKQAEEVDIQPIVKKFKNNLEANKYAANDNSNTKKKTKIDSIKLREFNGSIGSNEQRQNLPLSNGNENENEYFTNDHCENCNKPFITKAAKLNHIAIFRSKSKIVYIPANSFDVHKHMVAVCVNRLCCVSFKTADAYYKHITNA